MINEDEELFDGINGERIETSADCVTAEDIESCYDDPWGNFKAMIFNEYIKNKLTFYIESNKIDFNAIKDTDEQTIKSTAELAGLPKDIYAVKCLLPEVIADLKEEAADNYAESILDENEVEDVLEWKF